MFDDEECRGKVQDSILDLASSELEQDDEASLLLSQVAGAFLDTFLVNLKAELEDKQKKEDISYESPIDDESSLDDEKTESEPNIEKQFYVCKAVPNYRIISTNTICSALNRMKFPSIASEVEEDSIQINERRRDECFAAVKTLPFVSDGAHLLLARDLTENGININPEEVNRMMVEKKKPVVQKVVKKKGHLKKKRNKDSLFF